MKNKIFDIFMWIVTFILIGGIFFLPKQVPLHWNLEWEIDRYGSRYELLIIMLIPIVTYYGMLLAKNIDPEIHNIQKKNKTYELIRKSLAVFLVLLMGFIYLMILKPHMNGTFIICLLIGVFLIVLGNYMPKFPKNYFLGVRTPWTLSNEWVWKQTHRMSGYCFVVGGLFIIVGGLLPSTISFIIILSITILMTIFSLFYSYLLYKRID